MDTLEAIRQRRSIKHFDAAHSMSAAQEKELLELAMLSPTAFNLQHWRLVVVKDGALRKAIRTAAHDQAQVTDASLLIAVCADTQAWAKSPERYWANAPEQARQMILPWIEGSYKNNAQRQRDESYLSCGMVAQSIMIAAKGMGYDSCPMEGFDFELVSKLIKLPADHVLTMLIAVGKAAKPANPRAGQLPYSEIVRTNTF